MGTNASTLFWIRWAFSRPEVLVGIFGALVTLLIMPFPPTLMVTDSHARVRDAHWIWSGESPNGVVPGVDGTQHNIYGLGQTLLFVVPDFLLTQVGFSDGNLRSIAVYLLVFPLINAAVMVFGWLVSRELGYSQRASTLNVVVLLVCTTLLWHFQNNQENPLILALAFAAIFGLLRWESTGDLKWLHFACAAQAWNVLVRIPNLAIVLPIFLLPVLTRWLRRNGLQGRLGSILRTDMPRIAFCAAPWFLLSLFLDRLWQRCRFGSWSGTYMEEFRAIALERSPDLPKEYPFQVPFFEGFSGFFLMPSKSIFLFEGLIIPLLVAAWLMRRKLPPAVIALLLLMSVSILGTAVGYARFAFWHSEPNWGARYIATPCHVLQLPAAALMLSAFRHTFVAVAGRIYLGVLFLIGVSSLWLPAYHEMVIKGGGNGATVREMGPMGTPPMHMEPDWRVVLRTRDIVSDLREPIFRRMLLPVQPLASMSWIARLGICGAWWCGLGLTVYLFVRLLRFSDEVGSSQARIRN